MIIIALRHKGYDDFKIILNNKILAFYILSLTDLVLTQYYIYFIFNLISILLFLVGMAVVHRPCS